MTPTTQDGQETRSGIKYLRWLSASQVALVVKNLPADAGKVGDAGLNPGSGRFPGVGHDNPFWYSCLEKPMDRGVWQATYFKIKKGSRNPLKREGGGRNEARGQKPLCPSHWSPKPHSLFISFPFKLLLPGINLLGVIL